MKKEERDREVSWTPAMALALRRSAKITMSVPYARRKYIVPADEAAIGACTGCGREFVLMGTSGRCFCGSPAKHYTEARSP